MNQTDFIKHSPRSACRDFMNAHTLICSIVVAVNLFAASLQALADDEQNVSAARTATEFQVYHLVHSSPGEARRMLERDRTPQPL
jgi:hypothetical protein